MSEIIDTKIKQKELVNKFDIQGFIINSDLDNNIKELAKKAKLKVVQDKTVTLETYLIHFLG